MTTIDRDPGDEDERNDVDTRGTLAASQAVRIEVDIARRLGPHGTRSQAADRLYRAALAEQAAHRRAP